jgi:hypothetical protein
MQVHSYLPGCACLCTGPSKSVVDKGLLKWMRMVWLRSAALVGHSLQGHPGQPQ